MFNQEKLGKALSVRTIYLVDLLETQFCTQARNLSVYSILAFPYNYVYWYHSDTCSILPLSKHCPFGIKCQNQMIHISYETDAWKTSLLINPAPPLVSLLLAAAR